MRKRIRRLLGRLHFKFLIRSILVITLGVLTFETISFYKMSNLTQELILEQMKRSVKNTSAKIDEQITRLTTDLEIISGLPSLEAYYLNLGYGLHREAEEYQQSLEAFFNRQSSRNTAYMAFKICDTHGESIRIFSPNAQSRALAFSIPCQKDHASGSDVQIRYQNPQPYLHFIVASKPVYRGEKYLGMVELYFDLTPQFVAVETYPIYRSGFLAVVNATGHPLSSENPQRLALQQQAFRSVQQRAGSSDLLEIQSETGETLLIYQSHLKQIDWSVIAMVFEKEIFAALYQQIQLAIYFIIAMIITEAFFLNYFTKRLILHRIESLVVATRHILSGDYHYRISEVGNDEITELSSRFNHMTESLLQQQRRIIEEQENLTNSKRQLQSVMDNSAALINIKDVQGKYLLVNGAFCRYFGRRAEDIVGKYGFDFLPPQDAENYQQNDLQVVAAKAPIHFEEIATNHNNETNTFITVKFPLTDEKGDIYAICGISTDITKRIEEEKALQRLNAKLSLANTLLESIEEGVVITDANYHIIDMNPALEKLFGYSRQELLGKQPSIFRSKVHPPEFFEQLYARLESHGSWHGEIWEQTKSGVVIPQLLTVTSMRDEAGKITHYAGIYADITDLKQTEAKLHKLAHYDALTGLANRLLLEERTSQAILLAQREHYRVVMLFIDLDNFKYINDTLGHDIGDELLKQVAQRFQHIIRETDTLARQGGDEFVLLLSKTIHSNDARLIAEKIREAGSQPFHVNAHELYISTSIGIAIYPDDAASTSELLKCSDMAMYAAKESGKNNFHFYSAELNHAAVDRLKIERSLRQALDDNQLELYFQAQADADTGEMEKLEALLRWPQVGGDFIAPDLFIPIAEESGIIIKLGEWVVDRAMQAIVTINQQRENPIAVSINLSARQFRQYDLANKLKILAQKYQLNPALVEFEVTESLLVEDYRLAEKILQEIKAYGFSLALDDFGTGYSSLSYLKHFPLDTLKLDKTFMQDLTRDARNQAIVSASVNMGRALGMKVVCEGVETDAQYQFVRSLGGVKVQGYFLSVPAPLEAFLN